MGKLVYGNSGVELTLDDRPLNHVRVVVLAKLRRGESFSLSWENDRGHHMLWLHPSIPLYFSFAGKRHPSLNRAWIDELMRSANSPNGLEVVPEPTELER
jgi:hypothetical protein